MVTTTVFFMNVLAGVVSCAIWYVIWKWFKL